MTNVMTLDASVFVASCRPQEPGFHTARALLHVIRDAGTPLIEPAILPVEVAAALSRTGDDPTQALEYAETVMALPYLTLLAVDERLARHAAKMAAVHGLRGADALYVASAARYGARLVTLDKEQLRRSPDSVDACMPEATFAKAKA
jgi:predicted nucleic acid-binding protein